MKYKPIILSFVFFSLAFNAVGQNTDALDKAVKDLSREESLKHSTLAVSVYSIDNNKEVYSFNSQRSVVPASLNKLFTTAVGFDKLGHDFRFKTTIAYSGNLDEGGTLHGDLYIIGGGDPVLGSYRYKQTMPDSLFAEWTRAIKGLGIRAVAGRIYYDESIFDRHPLGDAWQWGDIGNYYGSGVSGLNFHENMFFVYFTPGSRVGTQASISRISPAGLQVHTINEVMTGPAKSGDQVVFYGDPVSTIRTCSGTIPVDSKNFSVRASLPNPAQACAELFTSYLRSHSIQVSGSPSEAGRRPSDMKTIFEYTSPIYYIIAQYTNMTSNNTYAESIFKYLGYRVYGLGTYTNGARVVKEFCQNHRIESSGVKIVDGSGLSATNRVTADFVCRFLVEVSKCSFFTDFHKSLALAGENGTVKNLLQGLPSNVSVRVKSGTMTGVRAFAGYVTSANGQRYCFSVICNDYECSGTQMRSKLEKIIMKIATME